MSPRVQAILDAAMRSVPVQPTANEEVYRQLVPELNEPERDELALSALAVMRHRYPDVAPEVMLSTMVFGLGIGRAIERLHQDGEL